MVLHMKLPRLENKVVKAKQNHIKVMDVTRPKKRDNVQRLPVIVDLSHKIKKDKTIQQI